MVHLPIQRPFGSQAIGDTAEESGFGYLVIGRDPQGLVRFGYLDTGNREKEVGSGIEDIGNTVEKKVAGLRFQVLSLT
jgi:hypothetical protein